MSRSNSPSRSRSILGIAVSITLAGCAVGPDYVPPERDVPAAWSQVDEQNSEVSLDALADWWRLFDDPALNQLIDQAIAGNPDRDLALARVREARARFRVSKASGRPSLSSGVTASTSESADLTGDIDWRDLYDIGLDATWEIDVFGGTRRAVEAADATIEVTQAEYIDVMTSLVAEVALTYVDLRTLQERLQITRADVANQEETFRLVRWRREAGLTTALELEQARSNLQLSRADIPALERDLAQTRNQLSLLLGESPGELDSILGNASAIPSAPINVAIGVPTDTLRQRSDIRSAERNLAAQSARIGIATANLYPSFRLTGSSSRSAADASDLFEDAARLNSLAASVTAPIFNAGQLRANVEIEDALYAQSLASYERSVLNALREVEDALAAQTTARERTETLRLALRSAERANALATQEYAAGVTGFDQVLDTQRTLLAAEEQFALNLSAETTAAIALYKAVGGGWSAAVDVDPLHGDDND